MSGKRGGMRAILCHNPEAGEADHSKAGLLDALERAGIEARYLSLKSDAFPGMLSERADLIIAAGGDGAVANVAKAMPDRSIPLAIVPLGTANNIAKSFNIAGSAHALARGWDLGRSRPLDMGVVKGAWGAHPFVEAVGWGPLPEMILKKSGSEPTAKVGEGRDALREEIAEAEPMDVRLVIDGAAIATDDILAIEVVNVAYTGPVLPLLPRGGKPQGTLGIAVIKCKEREATMSWLQAPHSGRAPFAQLTGRRIELEWRDAPLRVDDAVMELPGGLLNATARISGRPVKLLVPSR
jgi:diacylglycerol kinase family enzyme